MLDKIKNILNQVIACLRTPLACLCRIWSWLLDLWQVLKPCRFSLISLIIGFVFFGLAPQGIDILRAMTETGENNLGSFALFYACIWLWALSIWYWARHMLSFEHIYTAATNKNNLDRSKRLIEEVPRVLGALAFLSIWFAFIKTGHEYSETIQDGFAIDTDFLAYLYFFSAVIFYLFAKYRRSIFGKMLGLTDTTSLHSNFRRNFGDLPRVAKTFVQVLILVTIVAFGWTTFAPVSVYMIGTANLLLIASANWIFIGTVLVFYGDKFRFPVFIMLLVLAFIFSTWNDNHVMRIHSVMSKQTDTRLTIDAHFERWLTPRLQTWQQQHGKEPYPLYIVAAEGGGIRAAYWSASLLGAMQDSNPAFASHIYAMSGVSGGSLGIATFASLVRAADDNKAMFTLPCFKDRQLSYQQCAHAMLSRDFLAPVAGRMLYGDLIQRFLPFPVKSFDRAQALELGWEAAWKDLSGTDYFNKTLLSLYEKNKGLSNVPTLFLNSTWVEQGRRVVSSNVNINKHFITVHDLHNMTNKHLRLSTAVHNSARFSYVSPAGTVFYDDGKMMGHLIDGGYFENSGATTAMEILNSIKLKAGDRWSRIRPAILMITNDPNLDDTSIKDPNPYANELRSPIEGLLNTRGGRGSYARAALKKSLVDKHNFKEFGLQNVDGPVPLGWMLSDAAKTTMQKRLECYMKEMGNDPFNIPSNRNCNKTK